MARTALTRVRSREFIETSYFGVANNKVYYRFNTGKLTTDSTTNAHTLTAISDPAETASGVFKGAVVLDGNDAYSATDHADFQPTGAFSLGLWETSSAITNLQMIFQSYSKNTNNAGFVLYALSTSGKLVLEVGKNTGTTSPTHYVNVSGNINVIDGNWHFIVFTYDGSQTYDLYVDGALDYESTWANAPAYAATNYVRIGCWNKSGTNSNFFTGTMDDIWLLNGTALTAAQILALYKGNWITRSNASARTVAGARNSVA